jgi:hypothetical protein
MAIPPDPTGGFGPDQAAQLLRAVHGLDPSSALLRPALAVAAIGVGIALTAGQVAARLRRTAPASVRPPGTRPTTRGEGTPQTDRQGRGRRNVLRDVVDIAEQRDEERVSYWGDILVERSVILWHGPPKTGKSTLLSEGLKHIIRGQPYLGWDTTKTAAVYFSEETSGIWKDKAAGIAGVQEPVCPWWQAWMPPGPLSYGPIRRPSLTPRWLRRMRGYRSVFHVEGPSVPYLRGLENLPALMAYADGTARGVGARLIIFDTLKHFCSEAQSASEHADVFINAVKGLAARGYCVIVVHHDNDNGKPLGPKSLQGGVDALVHQHRVKGLPEKASDREVEFEGRFRLGGAPETLRYRLDPQTVAFVRVGSSIGKTVPQTLASAQSDVRTFADSANMAPLPLPVLTAPTPLRVVTTPPGRDAICQSIMVQLAGENDGPWTQAALVRKIVAAGVVKRAGAYAHIAHLLDDRLLVKEDDERLALRAAEKEATA